MAQAKTKNAGDLRHKVTIQQLSQRPDADTGEPVQVWTDLATVWASIEPLTAAEIIRAKQAQMDISHRVYLRYFAALTPTCRLNYQGRILNISGIVNIDERSRWQELTCIEVA